MSEKFRFNRLELAGSLGDLGTLLPLAMALILVNGLNPLGVFFSIGIYYLAAGLYFGVTVPVQPMKVIGAYAVATAMSAEQILASALMMAIILLFIGVTGAIESLRKITPPAVIRGVQLATGILLMSGGVRFLLGTSRFQEIHQAAEPFLKIQTLGPVPIGLIIGVAAGLLTLLLLDSRKFPAGLVVILGGLATGLALGSGLSSIGRPGLHLPQLLPVAFPQQTDFTFALFALVLPQLPMTLGNAVLAYTDLSRQYFGKNAVRVTNRRVCLSMAAANVVSFLLGGMPLCHGAGGLAAHYRFGARTAGSNIMIGLILGASAIAFGDKILTILHLLPMAVLGVLLLFAGAELALRITDLKNRRDFFVALLMLGITLASNLAAGFITGIIAAHILKWKKLSV